MSGLRWHESVLPPRWQEAATILDRAGVTRSFYLAGGTGLALQLGHRVSVDLDLFTPEKFSARGIRDSLQAAPGLVVHQLAEHTLHAEVAATQVSFLRYPYPQLFDRHKFHELAVADIRDIACMKLDALSSRGSRRDFVDLFFVLREYPLRQLLEWFDHKYQQSAPNRIHLAKAMTYFADAEAEPMPNMLQAADWPRIRAFFEKEVPAELKF